MNEEPGLDMCTAMRKTDTRWEPALQRRELSRCALVA